MKVATTKGAALAAFRAWKKLADEIERSESSQSESEYLTVFQGYCEDDGMYGLEINVRISDHELPPTYGLRDGWPDLEVYVNVPRPMALHWERAVEKISARLLENKENA